MRSLARAESGVGGAPNLAAWPLPLAKEPRPLLALVGDTTVAGEAAWLPMHRSLSCWASRIVFPGS